MYAFTVIPFVLMDQMGKALPTDTQKDSGAAAIPGANATVASQNKKRQDDIKKADAEDNL